MRGKVCTRCDVVVDVRELSAGSSLPFDRVSSLLESGHGQFGDVEGVPDACIGAKEATERAGQLV